MTFGAEVKSDREVKDDQRVLCTERYCGSAYRRFTLPTEIDGAASEAEYDKGILELKLVKKVRLAGRKLSVQ